MSELSSRLVVRMSLPETEAGAEIGGGTWGVWMRWRGERLHIS